MLYFLVLIMIFRKVLICDFRLLQRQDWLYAIKHLKDEVPTRYIGSNCIAIDRLLLCIHSEYNNFIRNICLDNNDIQK